MMRAPMPDGDRLPRCVQLERAIALLNEALNIIDDLADRPDIGARLQQVLESLQEDCLATPRSPAT